jgi:hypothetical protein
MSNRLRNNLIAGFIVLILAGCSVFPNTTSVSASSKASNIDNPTIKATQTFKWSKE